jgi:hypothetical protein
MPTPRVTRLVGQYEELSGDDPSSAEIEQATRIEHESGAVEYLVHQTDPDYPWEARLTAQPGSRTFKGHMWSSEWSGRYEIEAELWVAPDGDESLLLGWCTSDDEDEDEDDIAFTLVLFEDFEEDDDDDEA